MTEKAQSPLQVGRECILKAVGRVLVVEILGIAKDTIWINFPTVDAILEGTGVELVLQGEDGFMSYHARVAVAPKDTSKGIMLERTETAAHMKSRRNWRVPVDTPIWIRLKDSEEKFKAQMKDLTPDGSLLFTEAPFNATDLIEMTFQLPETPTQQLIAQIVYDDKTKDTGVHRFGIRFIEVDREVKESITFYLYERIQDTHPEQLRGLYPPPPRTRAS